MLLSHTDNMIVSALNAAIERVKQDPHASPVVSRFIAYTERGEPKVVVITWNYTSDEATIDRQLEKSHILIENLFCDGVVTVATGPKNIMAVIERYDASGGLVVEFVTCDYHADGSGVVVEPPLAHSGPPTIDGITHPRVLPSKKRKE